MLTNRMLCVAFSGVCPITLRGKFLYISVVSGENHELAQCTQRMGRVHYTRAGRSLMEFLRGHYTDGLL